MSNFEKEYAREKLTLLIRDLDYYTRDEFWREMSRIASGATGLPHAEQLERENADLKKLPLVKPLAFKELDSVWKPTKEDYFGLLCDWLLTRGYVTNKPQSSLTERDHQQKRAGFELAWRLLEDAAINSLENGYSELKDALDEVKDKSDIPGFDKQVREGTA